jgi:hypothetical protein
MLSRRGKSRKSQQMARKAAKPRKQQEKLKTKAKAQNQHSPLIKLSLKLSMQALPLR